MKSKRENVQVVRIKSLNDSIDKDYLLFLCFRWNFKLILEQKICCKRYDVRYSHCTSRNVRFDLNFKMKLFDLVAGLKIPRYSMFKSLISRHVLAKEIAVSRSGRLLRTWTHTHPHTRIVHRHSCSIKMRCDLKNVEGEGRRTWERMGSGLPDFSSQIASFPRRHCILSVLHLPEEFVRFNSERQTIRIPTMEQE